MMTDKQVIIDGIDVSGCDFLGVKFATNRMCACSMIDFCNEEPNCYYKQLKRTESKLACKEQECEEWQAELADKASELHFIEEKIKPFMKRPDDLDCYNLEWIVVAFVDEFNQLKVENEELKKQVNDLLHKPEIQNKILWKIDNEALLGSKDAWIYKLEKTLTEIKEIANYSFNLSTSELMTKLEQILQKINECEVE